jgi:hypothetical protein
MDQRVDESQGPIETAPPRPAIGISLPCHRCGYEMRGLDPMAVCPECGEPVWRSIAEAVDLVPIPLDEPSARGLARALDALAATSLAITIATAVPPAAWIPAAWSSEFAAIAGRGMLALGSAAISILAAAGVLGSLAMLWSLGRRAPLAAAMLVLPRRLLILGAVPWGLTMLALHRGLLPPIATTAVAGTALGVVLLACSLAAERLGPVSRRWQAGGIAIQRPRGLVAALAIALASIGVRGAIEAWQRQGGGAWTGLSEGLWAASAFASMLSMLLVCVGAAYLAVNLRWIARDLRRRRPGIGEVIDTGR